MLLTSTSNTPDEMGDLNQKGGFNARGGTPTDEDDDIVEKCGFVYRLWYWNNMSAKENVRACVPAATCQ